MQQKVGAFQENLSIICDELHLAKQWGKASIILTIHKSTLSLEKTKRALQKKIEGLGFRIVECDICKSEGNFIKRMLLTENIENVVFYISNIDWGGGKDEKDGYRILNLYRETFIEHKVKVVFFLTLREASNLPNYAPDFWAFRHHVLEFRNPRSTGQQKMPVGLMLWHIENSITSICEVKSKIPSLMQMLAEIPDGAEAVSVRTDLCYELGFLHWKLGDQLGAVKALTDGIRLAEAHELIDSKVKCLNGLSIVWYEQEKYECAMKILISTIKEKPQDCLLTLNQAVVLFAQKKRYRAIEKGKKATSLCAQNPWIWNSLGFLYLFAGDMDEAVICFKEAIGLSPKSSYFYESLSICYLAMGLQDKALVQLRQARDNFKSRGITQDVLEEGIEGNTENVSCLIGEAISAGELTKVDVMRDPTLRAILSVVN